MIGQIFLTVFVAWLFIGLLLMIIGSFSNDCINHIYKIGVWLFGSWIGTVDIIVFVCLIILIWE